MDEDEIKSFLSSLNSLDYQSKIKACKAIPQSECINNTDEFFKQLELL